MATFPKTLAALNDLFRELSLLENDLRAKGESIEGVQLQKKLTWAEMVEREKVAGLEEKLDAETRRLRNN